MNNLAASSVMCGNFSINSLAESIERVAREDFLSQLPEELLLRIFGYLNAIELTKSGEVSRRWSRLASDATLWNDFDLRKISPLLKVFDESDWVTHVDLSAYGLSVEDVPSIDKRKTIPVLKRCLSSLSIEENVGITLLTIPKGLTFNKLVMPGLSPKMGNIPIVSEEFIMQIFMHKNIDGLHNSHHETIVK